MIKGMMGPQRGNKALFNAAKAGEVQRDAAGKINTMKLPTTLAEWQEVQDRTFSSVSERRPLNPRVRG